MLGLVLLLVLLCRDVVELVGNHRLQRRIAVHEVKGDACVKMKRMGM